ncbi:hypothetical protein CMV_028400 [Castanea mollissima]|uniref:RNase H type-1 domain-containing protein n=1 Tax=Castanea mollissima TaxID=60419 RepID=A0A8J4VED6_9ROSI|nr:hypothetical protein CMV_028400 [Castanea mollissima]
MRTNEAALPSSKLAQTASALLAKFQQGKQQQQPKKGFGPVQWQPPPVDTVKANFDRAVFGANQEASIGVFLRNNEGLVLAALSERVMMLVSVEILEMLAARSAALFARELGFCQEHNRTGENPAQPVLPLKISQPKRLHSFHFHRLSLSLAPATRNSLLSLNNSSNPKSHQHDRSHRTTISTTGEAY